MELDEIVAAMKGRIAAFFSDWKNDPLLAEAYVQAMEWSGRGGTSPL